MYLNTIIIIANQLRYSSRCRLREKPKSYIIDIDGDLYVYEN